MGQRHGRLSRSPRRNWASPLMAGLVRSRKAQFRQHCRGSRGLRKLASDLLGPAATVDGIFGPGAKGIVPPRAKADKLRIVSVVGRSQHTRAVSRSSGSWLYSEPLKSLSQRGRGLSTKMGGSFSAGSACRAEELRFFLAAKTALYTSLKFRAGLTCLLATRR